MRPPGKLVYANIQSNAFPIHNGFEGVGSAFIFNVAPERVINKRKKVRNAGISKTFIRSIPIVLAASVV